MRVLYLLMLVAVFTGTFSYFNFMSCGEVGHLEAEQDTSRLLSPALLFSGMFLSDSEVVRFLPSLSKQLEGESGRICKEDAEEYLIAYVQLFPGTDVGVLDSWVRVEEWDEDSSIAAVRVNLESFEELSSLKGVHSVQPVISPVIRKVGREEKVIFSSFSEEFWKPKGVTGAGIKIGLISDGVEDISEAMASGVLPEDVHVLSSGKGREGTVMLEIVSETSPGAELYFHSAGSNKLEFNKAIDALIAEGCQIICDDVGWPDEPFFEDGIVASHIKEVIESQDILYVSAAGNDAGRHYQGMFFDNGSGWHDFSSGASTYQNIRMDVPSGEKVTVVLQWNDPWSCSVNDYDLYLYDCCSGKEIGSSEKVQSGAETPLEYLKYVNREEAAKTVGISVKKHSGEDRVLEVYIYPNSSVKVHPDNLVEEDSVFGHPAVPGVICVGAVDSKGQENQSIAPYSSRGPVSIYYPEQELRNKTDLSGPGRVRVSGSTGTGSFFMGTSASAPSVAGIGALIWSMYPEKNGSEIRGILCSSAEDLGEPGYDTIFGYGSVNDRTVHLLENISPGDSLLLEKSGVSPVETEGIFILKLSMPLEQIYSLANLPARAVVKGSS
ncbi:S8 family serine peptidase [Methanosarcina sp. WWM596]|uniref:S8 family peptidase n=1 Tax=Methanosarcina sp. WWM596 TaxID=1434103 RepID=UPI000AB0C0AE|nr:S8 family serine peptidase [Methanosarcina sp. WWM596]